MRRRYWALVVVALGGTLLNLQVLAAASQPAQRAVAAGPAAPADGWIEAARAFGLYADAANWATPPKIAFSERETLLLTVLGLALIALLPPNESAD